MSGLHETRNPLLVRMSEMIIEARTSAGRGKLRALNDTVEARQAQTAANREILSALRDRDSELARRRCSRPSRRHGRERRLPADRS